MPDILPETWMALLKLLVLAVLLEQALTPLFNWRVFLAIFNDTGWRTPITFAVALSAVNLLDLQALDKLLVTYGGNVEANKSLVSIMTAAILAGGSSGVHNVLTSLGFRDDRIRTQKLAEIRPTPADESKAWLAITIHRRRAVGTIHVSVTESSIPNAVSPTPLSGTLGGTATRRALRALFFRDRDRFPPSGGHTLKAGVAYSIAVTARDSGDVPFSSKIDGVYVLGPRAVVDLVAEM